MLGQEPDLNTCFMTKSRESFLQAVHIFISFYLYFALSEHGPKPWHAFHTHGKEATDKQAPLFSSLLFCHNCGHPVFKVAEHSFLVPLRYSSLFSNHWQLGSQNWQDASSTKQDYILICFIGQNAVAMAMQLVIKPALNNGFDLFSENPVVRFFPSFVSRKLRAILAYRH